MGIARSAVRRSSHCATHLVLRLDVGAGVDQQLDDLDVTVGGGPLQCRAVQLQRDKRVVTVQVSVRYVFACVFSRCWWAAHCAAVQNEREGLGVSSDRVWLWLCVFLLFCGQQQQRATSPDISDLFHP